MKLFTRARILEFWEIKKIYIIAVLFLAFILIGYYIFKFNPINFKVDKTLFKDPGFVGILGSLIGALVGGILSMYGAIYVNRAQSIAKSAINRKNIIYTPLYDELKQVQDIITENPYPSRFSFDISHQTIIPQPQFNAWKRIKGDSRGLQVPKYIACNLDELTDIVENYLSIRASAAAEIQRTINEVLNKSFNTTCSIRNLGEVILPKVLKGSTNRKLFESYFDNALIPAIEINSEQRESLEEVMYIECHKLETVKNLKQAWQTLEDKLKDLIHGLGVIIGMINKKYEFHENRF